jgi:DNA-binding transcriptional regulator GbsR (MarR family)
MTLPPLSQKFVSHFGEMGSRWGFNRTVGQIYALLFLTPEPLNADTIGDLLGFSRSNVSIGLKELQSWRLVKMTHQSGDRREYFSTLGDVWDIFKAVAAERHRREVEPTGTVLRELLLDAPANEQEAYAQKRIESMHDLVEQVNKLFSELQGLSPETLATLMSVGLKVQKAVALKGKVLMKKNKKDLSAAV